MTTEHPVVAFIRARLDEWEETAKRAAFGWGGQWSTRHETDDGVEWSAVTAPGSRNVLTTEDGDCATHAALNDPAHVLRQVDALRAVLDLHEAATDHTGSPILHSIDAGAPHPGCTTCGAPGEWYHHEWPCETLRALAAIWSDHPDYQPEWAPDTT